MCGNRICTLWQCPARCVNMTRVNYEFPLDRKNKHKPTIRPPLHYNRYRMPPQLSVVIWRCIRYPVSKVRVANMGPTWGHQGPTLAPWILLSRYAILPYVIHYIISAGAVCVSKYCIFTPVFHISITRVWIITAPAFYGVFILVFTLENNERNISGVLGCSLETSNI